MTGNTEAGERPNVVQTEVGCRSAKRRPGSAPHATLQQTTPTPQVQSPAASSLAFTVDASGTVRCLYDERFAPPVLASLGPLTIERASHVEPTSDGRWTADLSPVGGPLLGPFNLRSEALAAEAAWIDAHVLSCQSSKHA